MLWSKLGSATDVWPQRFFNGFFDMLLKKIILSIKNILILTERFQEMKEDVKGKRVKKIKGDYRGIIMIKVNERRNGIKEDNRRTKIMKEDKIRCKRNKEREKG